MSFSSSFAFVNNFNIILKTIIKGNHYLLVELKLIIQEFYLKSQITQAMIALILSLKMFPQILILFLLNVY